MIEQNTCDWTNDQRYNSFSRERAKGSKFDHSEYLRISDDHNMASLLTRNPRKKRQIVNWHVTPINRHRRIRMNELASVSKIVRNSSVEVSHFRELKLYSAVVCHGDSAIFVFHARNKSAENAWLSGRTNFLLSFLFFLSLEWHEKREGMNLPWWRTRREKGAAILSRYRVYIRYPRYRSRSICISVHGELGKART